MNAEKHPLDFDALQRGDKIPVERVERAVEMRRDHPNYRFGQLRLAGAIEAYFLDVRGDDVVVRCCDDGLQLLTHEEQADYVQVMARSGLRKFGRSFRKANSVRLDALDDARRERTERFLHTTAFRLQQLRKRPPPALTNKDNGEAPPQ